MEPEDSLPHSQAFDTCPYPGPAQSSPHTKILRYIMNFKRYSFLNVKVKVNFTADSVMKAYRGIEAYLYSFFNVGEMGVDGLARAKPFPV